MGDFTFRPYFLRSLRNVDSLRLILLFVPSAANFRFVVVTVSRNNIPRIGVAYRSGKGGGGGRD
jgi:hypothetical protein